MKLLDEQTQQDPVTTMIHMVVTILAQCPTHLLLPPSMTGIRYIRQAENEQQEAIIEEQLAQVVLLLLLRALLLEMQMQDGT